MENLRVIVKWVIQYWHENEQFYLEQWLDERTPQQFKSIVKEIKLLERCVAICFVYHIVNLLEKDFLSLEKGLMVIEFIIHFCLITTLLYYKQGANIHKRMILRFHENDY